MAKVALIVGVTADLTSRRTGGKDHQAGGGKKWAARAADAPIWPKPAAKIRRNSMPR